MVQLRRRWTNVKPTLIQRLVFAGITFLAQIFTCHELSKLLCTQSQKTGFAYFTSEQILPFDFAEQHRCHFYIYKSTKKCNTGTLFWTNGPVCTMGQKIFYVFLIKIRILQENEMKLMEPGDINKMTLPSRHWIRNSRPGGLVPSTLPLGHGGSPQY